MVVSVKSRLMPCLKFPRPPTSSMICYQDSQNSAYNHTHTMIYYSKSLQNKSAKGKVHGEKTEGNQAQASKRPLPVESHRMYLILYQQTVTIHVKCPLRNPIRFSDPFYFFLVALGLGCGAQAFSSCSEQGLLSSCSAWASQCGGFLVAEHGEELQQTQLVGSRVLAQQLGHVGSVAPHHGQSSQARDPTHVLCISRQIPNHWTAREGQCSVFIGGWPCRHPPPSMHQSARLPEEKQVFSRSHIVYPNSLGLSEPPLSVLGIVGIP